MADSAFTYRGKATPGTSPLNTPIMRPNPVPGGPQGLTPGVTPNLAQGFSRGRSIAGTPAGQLPTSSFTGTTGVPGVNGGPAQYYGAQWQNTLTPQLYTGPQFPGWARQQQGRARLINAAMGRQPTWTRPLPNASDDDIGLQGYGGSQ